jgi:hypothetical protein
MPFMQLGSEAAPIIVDVRRDADFASAETLVAVRFIARRITSNNGELTCRAGAKSTYCVHDMKSGRAWPRLRLGAWRRIFKAVR